MNRITVTCVAALSCMSALTLLVLGLTINRGSEFDPLYLLSDGTTPISGTLTIQLGAFNPGFVPNGANVDLWAANWNVFDTLLPNEHFSAVGCFSSERELPDNSISPPQTNIP